MSNKDEITKLNEILNFIKNRRPMDLEWLERNSYWFANMLKERFAALDIFYLPVKDYFLAGNEFISKYFDCTGEVQSDEKPIRLSDIISIDENLYFRLMKKHKY